MDVKNWEEEKEEQKEGLKQEQKYKKEEELSYCRIKQVPRADRGKRDHWRWGSLSQSRADSGPGMSTIDFRSVISFVST